MGNLSEHFGDNNFFCRCKACGSRDYRIHLGLVGALEAIMEHFGKPLEVVSGYWCDDFSEKQTGGRKTAHNKGKAAHIKIKDVPLTELFKFAETIPELNGVGYYPAEGFIHVDTRKEEKSLWAKEGDKYIPLTPEKRTRYGL
ncbi:MAG: D-Ala-D-Ala carboxypeptidase family metallohydrolase [Candidatus Saganbacteria bacterium]|nr:D-Ala-D-Ala carboxypeptidase family metallohydrolase [Candidatus Saganbacteria bacterium]